MYVNIIFYYSSKHNHDILYLFNIESKKYDRYG